MAVISINDSPSITPMSQEAVDAALKAPELWQALTYRAEHKPVEMVAAFRTAADQGNAIAQLQLAQLYHRDIDVPQDDMLADYWLHKAAAQGLGEAQVTLAEGYFAGEGERQNPAQGWRWLRIAEAQERPAIWAMIGEVYLAGVTPVATGRPQDIADIIDATGRSQDLVAALSYFHRAAAAGDENGELALCLFYMQGQGGTAPSRKEGQPWCDRAAARGNMVARKYTTVSSQLPKSLPQPGEDGAIVTVLNYIGQGSLVLVYISLYILANSNLHISAG